MKLPVLRYVCDGCGLCCTETMVSANEEDLCREPLLEVLPEVVDKEQRRTGLFLMNKDPDDPTGCGCRFNVEKRCTIYPTRPSVCVGFKAGSPDCQYLRKACGVPELQPTAVEVEEKRTVCVEMMPDIR